MKTKEHHIEHWLAQSNDDWEAAELLFAGKKYLHSLFFAHLSLEKVCKAHWINSSEINIPPKTHNLIFLLSQTALEISDNQKEFLIEFNRFQIEGRYPELISKLRQTCTPPFTRNKLNEAKELHLWLLSKLP